MYICLVLSLSQGQEQLTPKVPFFSKGLYSTQDEPILNFCLQEIFAKQQ